MVFVGVDGAGRPSADCCCRWISVSVTPQQRIFWRGEEFVALARVLKLKQDKIVEYDDAGLDVNENFCPKEYLGS